MRVDLTQSVASQIATEPNTKSVGANSSASTGVSSVDDRTTFSSDLSSVSSLAGTAMNSPAIREDLVASLKQAIESGQYKLDPAAIATSMIDEQA